MEITIKIQAPELAHALETLAIAIGCTVDKMNVGEAIKDAVVQGNVTKDIKKISDEPSNVTKNNESVTESLINSTDDEPKFTLEEVRKALGDLSKSKGKEVAKSILSEFNVSKVTDLDKSQYNAAMQAIKGA